MRAFAVMARGVALSAGGGHLSSFIECLGHLDRMCGYVITLDCPSKVFASHSFQHSLGLFRPQRILEYIIYGGASHNIIRSLKSPHPAREEERMILPLTLLL